MIKKMIESEATIIEVDGITLANPREIGLEVAYQFIDEDAYIFEIYDAVDEYFANVKSEAVARAIELLEENNRKIKY